VAIARTVGKMARKDYKHLLVDAGKHKTYETKRRVSDKDMDATHSPMRNHSEFWNPLDYVAPLYRYLHRNVGRPWNKIYSEICRDASPKSLLGYHLREHIWDIVIPNDEVIKTEGGYRWQPKRLRGTYCFSRWHLFIDDYGILRKPKKKELRP